MIKPLSRFAFIVLVIFIGLATSQGIFKPRNSNQSAKLFVITTQTESEFLQDNRQTMVQLTLLMLLFGALGIRQAIFSFNFWQMSAIEACRLQVHSWF